MKISLIFTILCVTYSHAFINFENDQNYLFHYRSETSGTKHWITVNQSIDTEVIVKKSSNNLLIQLKNTKIKDEIDKPTADELNEMTYLFKIVLENNNSFTKYMSKEKEFAYCLKIKYRIVDMLLSDMSRFTKYKVIKSPMTKVEVKNLSFGNCFAKLKVIKGTDEIKIGVKAAYKDCHADERVNLATIFDLSPNSTTAVIVSMQTKDESVKKINVLSDMVTYNMGGLLLKIRSSLSFKGLIDEPVEFGMHDDFKARLKYLFL